MSAPILPGLPDAVTARVPDERDVPAVISLLADRRTAGAKPVDVDSTAANLIGLGSWTRRQLVVADQDRLLGWVVVHDRAAGRTNVDLTLAEDPRAAAVAAALLTWVDRVGADLARQRGVGQTQLDATPDESDERLQGWLATAGFAPVRRWLQMVRPVTAADRSDRPPPRPGVRVRRVAEHASGLPVAADVQTVHRVLEESFVDHFNSYRESFGEFVARLREDPWHRFDHWWIAEVDADAGPVPGGVVISSVSPPDAQGRLGSYVDYIGVHRRARGRGVAKALLATVVGDAAWRDRHRVGLEVDADSPTGADGLYRSLGWETTAVTVSWHRTVSATS